LIVQGKYYILTIFVVAVWF